MARQSNLEGIKLAVFHSGVVLLIVLTILAQHLVTSANSPHLSPSGVEQKTNEQTISDDSIKKNENPHESNRESLLYPKSDATNSSIKRMSTINISNLADINFTPKISTIEMYNATSISYNVVFEYTKLKPFEDDSKTRVLIQLETITKSPQFDIISIEEKEGQPATIQLSLDQIRNNNNSYNGSITVRASYIGHALVKAHISVQGSKAFRPEELTGVCDITVIRSDGRLELIFKVSVISLVMITYIGLGSQIERDRITKLMDSPMLPIMAFLITVMIMPIISWVLAYLIVGDQLYYRFGAFVLSCCPMASAATMWATMFKADKELSITLQLVSTVSALFTMPIWMFTLGVTLTQGQYDIKVPYLTLVQTLISLLLVLIIGYVIGNYSVNFADYVRKIIRPVTFAVLMFVILFSSYVYWYIYMMFDWRVMLLGSSISFSTYIICGFLGFVLKRDYAHLATVAIGSTYKNSGVAFSVLLVALPSPDTYIAFVPCLAQVLATSTMLYLILTVRYCFSYIVRVRDNYKRGKATKAKKDLEEIRVEGKSAGGNDRIDNPLDNK